MRQEITVFLSELVPEVMKRPCMQTKTTIAATALICANIMIRQYLGHLDTFGEVLAHLEHVSVSLIHIPHIVNHIYLNSRCCTVHTHKISVRG